MPVPSGFYDTHEGCFVGDVEAIVKNDGAPLSICDGDGGDRVFRLGAVDQGQETMMRGAELVTGDPASGTAAPQHPALSPRNLNSYTCIHP